MIISKLGIVQLTQPNYELCKILDTDKETVDVTVTSMLIVDLAAIIRALEKRYGTDKALKMYTDGMETFIKSKEMNQ